MANESNTVEAFTDSVLRMLRRFHFKELRMFVVLDKASTDQTLTLLQSCQSRCPELQIIVAPENRNVADAYVRGYRAAVQHGSDWILEIDAGFSHDPTEIPRFIEAIDEHVDCVYGSRFIPGASYSPGRWQRYVISRFGGMVAAALLGTALSDMTSGYQLFRRDALIQILGRGLRSRGPFFQTEMKFRARGMRVCEVPISYRAASHNVGIAAIWDALSVLVSLALRR